MTEDANRLGEKFFGKFKIWRRADGIFCGACIESETGERVDWTADDSEALRLAFRQANPKKVPMFTLMDIRKLSKSSGPSRRVRPLPETRRLALVVRSRVTRMLGRAYLGLHKPEFETSLFTTNEEAIEWLRDGMDATSETGNGDDS